MKGYYIFYFVCAIFLFDAKVVYLKNLHSEKLKL